MTNQETGFIYAMSVMRKTSCTGKTSGMNSMDLYIIEFRGIIMEADYDKLNFGRMLNETGPNGFITSSECHNYGSMSGCDENCPPLLKGECKVFHEFKDQLPDDILEELLTLYQ